MKMYQCDSCNKVIEDPYKQKMKEFVVICDFGWSGFFPEVLPTSQKVRRKINLCDDCFKGLKKIAKKKKEKKK